MKWTYPSAGGGEDISVPDRVIRRLGGRVVAVLLKAETEAIQVGVPAEDVLAQTVAVQYD
jgi:hypothetical protein